LDLAVQQLIPLAAILETGKDEQSRHVNSKDIIQMRAIRAASWRDLLFINEAESLCRYKLR